MSFNLNFDLKWLVIPAVIIVGLLVLNVGQLNRNSDLNTYNRQLTGALTDGEKELQELKTELGVSKAKLVTQEELAELIKKDKEEVDKAFEEFKKKHDLQIKSRDLTIARLEQTINGGSTSVVVADSCKGIEENCVISYNWEDTLKRFKLHDPSIFEKDNETFESSQVFKIYGEIYEEKEGSLKIRRLVLREVYLEDGKYKPVPDAKADVIDSEFTYSNEPDKLNSNWYDVFRLRAIALGSVTAIPDGGALRLGLGMEFFSWHGAGINTHTAFDFKDAKKIEQRLGLSYSPNLFNKELNLAIGASVGTPFYKAFNEYSFNIDLIFYLHQ